MPTKEGFVMIKEIHEIEKLEPGWELIEVIYRDYISAASKEEINHSAGYSMRETASVPLVLRTPSFLVGLRPDKTIEHLNERAKAAEALADKRSSEIAALEVVVKAHEATIIRQAEMVKNSDNSYNNCQADKQQIRADLFLAQRRLETLKSKLGTLQYETLIEGVK